MESYLSALPYVPPALTALWALICLRIYTMISTENPGQRRLVAIGGAVGAALIYVLASNIITLLQIPAEAPRSPTPEQEERVKVQLKG
ncbi:MAG: hypothetical protein CJBNEKGG_03791 [Prosthecobacter sp.]|nr:hypothetical protein [Prosthecobacter sp.]